MNERERDLLERLLQRLNQIQWEWDDDYKTTYCIGCGSHRGRKHPVDCRLQQDIDEADDILREQYR